MAYYPLTVGLRQCLEWRGTKIMDMQGKFGTTGDAVAHLVLNEGMRHIVVYGKSHMQIKDSLVKLRDIAGSLSEERIAALNGESPLTVNGTSMTFCGALVMMVTQETISRRLRGHSPNALIYAWL